MLLVASPGIRQRAHRYLATGMILVLAGCSSGSDGPGTTQPAAIASVAVSSAATGALVAIGETRALSAVARDASGATIASPALTWTSSATTVATVSGTGTSATVTAVGNGTTTITATGGATQGTLQLSVSQGVTSVLVSGLPITLTPGATSQLSAVARDARNNPVAGVTGFSFTSSDAGVAVVSATGGVTAIAPGTVVFTSTFTPATGAPITSTSSLTVAFAANQPSNATVEATNANVFTPQTVNISAGGSVTWSFGSVTHNVIFGGTAGAPANINNTASTQVSRAFPTPGTFNYDCTLHSGMRGTVVVGNAGSAPTFTALLNGANERPNPVTTQGNGAAAFTVNGNTVSYLVTFSRLTGAPAAAHIHGPGSASQSVGILVDLVAAGQTANTGVLTGTFNASNIRGQGGQPAISLDSVLVLMRTGNAYVNVHTSQFPGGEIRGQTGPR